MAWKPPERKPAPPLAPSLVEIYGARSSILHRLAAMGVNERALAKLLAAATDTDIIRAFTYLEGLVEWPDPEPSSADATTDLLG